MSTQNQDELKARIAELEVLLKNSNSRVSKGIGKYVMTGLEAGDWNSLSNKEIAKLVSAKFESETTAACIAWYKNKLVKNKKTQMTKELAELQAKLEVAKPEAGKSKAAKA